MSYIFAYPHDTKTNTVTLPDATLGNTDRVDTNRETRATRHGTYKSVKDSSWPAIKTKTLTFQALTAAERLAIYNFLNSYRGLKINLVDHNSNSFDGYIISPTLEYITVRDDCSYEVIIEFMEEPA